MPVPLASTHPKGRGLSAAVPAELPTSGGLFATFGSSAASAPPAAAPPAPAAAAPPTAAAHAAAPAAVDVDDSAPAIATRDLTFCYPGIDGRPLPGRPPVVVGMTMSLPRGATVLLVGPNGAGKTSLLKVLAGKHMVPRGAVSVLGSPPFYATALTSSGALAYVGGAWERDVAFAGYAVPIAGDIGAGAMLAAAAAPGGAALEARMRRLVDVLDIDPEWRLHRVSDGQRRRVQIAMGLLRPFSVLLLDEVTVDLDVLGRARLMEFLAAECRERGATVVYATHIFDGLEAWPSHVMYVAGGRLRGLWRAEELPELAQGRLLELVVGWLRAEKAEREAAGGGGGGGGGGQDLDLATWNNGWASGRLASTIKLASNAVLRM